MSAAEERSAPTATTSRAGAIIIANANRAQLEPSLKALGLTAYAVASAPTVKSHDLDIPRIGYIHSWTRTQDEGWVRAAFDTYGVPYKYFGENSVAKMGDLRSKFDVHRLSARRQRRRRRTRWPRRWRRGAGPARSVQEHEGIPVPRLPGFDRRRSRRARRRRHEGAVRVRAARRHAHHRRRHVADPAGDETHAGREVRSRRRASSRAERFSAPRSPTRRARSCTATIARKCRCTSAQAPVLERGRRRRGDRRGAGGGPVAAVAAAAAR